VKEVSKSTVALLFVKISGRYTKAAPHVHNAVSVTTSPLLEEASVTLRGQSTCIRTQTEKGNMIAECNVKKFISRKMWVTFTNMTLPFHVDLSYVSPPCVETVPSPLSPLSMADSLQNFPHYATYENSCSATWTELFSLMTSSNNGLFPIERKINLVDIISSIFNFFHRPSHRVSAHCSCNSYVLTTNRKISTNSCSEYLIVVK